MSSSILMISIEHMEMVSLRKSPRLSRVPTQELVGDGHEAYDALIGLTASRMHGKSSSDPGYTTPLRRGRGVKDGIVPGTPSTPDTPITPITFEARKMVPDNCEIEYLIRQRVVASAVQVYPLSTPSHPLSPLSPPLTPPSASHLFYASTM